jgi:hypothetical protein
MCINIDKCDLDPINIEKEDVQEVAQSLSCELILPINYFTIFLHHRKLKKRGIHQGVPYRSTSSWFVEKNSLVY